MAPRSLNKVLLLGHLGRDPEMRYTSSGKAMATFSLATSEQWKDKDGNDQERTEWHRIVAWGRLGEVCGEYLSKGKQVFIEGRIQSRDWEDQDGNKRTTVEIIASDMIMLGGTGAASRPARDDSSQGRGGEDFDRERRSRRPPDRKGESRRTSGEKYEPPPPEDDIPF